MIRLTPNEVVYFKRNMREMIHQAEKEFQEWKSTKNEVYLQQSCEKLFNALQQHTELVSGERFVTHQQFRETFRAVFAKQKDVLWKADDLHKFFYSGYGFERDTDYIEGVWKDVRGFLR